MTVTVDVSQNTEVSLFLPVLFIDYRTLTDNPWLMERWRH